MPQKTPLTSMQADRSACRSMSLSWRRWVTSVGTPAPTPCSNNLGGKWAGLAQWQCSGFVNRRSGVRIPHPAPRAGARSGIVCRSSVFITGSARNADFRAITRRTRSAGLILLSAAAHQRRGIRPQRSGRIRPTKVERRRCGARWSAILPKRASIGDQWKKVLSICVMPRRVIVEPSGSVITVLPPLTLAVATTLAMVPASWPAKLIASPCAWLNPTTVS